MNKLVSILFVLLFFCANGFAQEKLPVYLNDKMPIEDRIDDALSRMTVEEKVAMLHAHSKFSSPGVPRLGIPENWMTDGPHGIRAEVLWDEWNTANWTNDSCMAFPALTCLAATWNPEMSAIYGKAIGEEARYRNKNVLLGPGVNIYRTPLNGRNFEYMGEDPLLASRMVVPYIQKVQESGVAACLKHFALNNQEIARHTVNVTVDDRTLYEIYLPAFKAAVQEGGAWAIMGSYNRYKGQWCCQNEYLLNDILRGEWGFDGVVVSDWGGVNNTEHAIYHGLDMEFGTWTDGLSEGHSNAYDNYFLANPYLKLLREDKATTKELDQKVRNILRLAFRTTMDKNRPYGSFATPEHGDVARKVAEEGMVLLKNKDNVLPINLNQSKKVLVVGENAIKQMTIGGGSSSLKAKYEISPLQGIQSRMGKDVEVVYARGYVGEPVTIQDALVGQDLTDNRSAREMKDEALKLAKDADYVLFIGGLNKHNGQDCEGNDRASLGLPYGQDELISALTKVNKNTVVVLITGNAVAMPWINEVPAVLQAWYSGSEAGNALANILVGDANPSGKLPFTFPVKLSDVGAHAVGDYPGVNDEQTYNEGLFVGYRWNDKNKIKALFPFGHGLSYTTFTYGKVIANKKKISDKDSITFSVSVKNSGNKTGAEIVQLYISDKKSYLPRPLKELKGFEKVWLQPGEEKTVSITIDKDALSFFDDKLHKWVIEPGQFEALLGSSSEDIKGKVMFELE